MTASIFDLVISPEVWRVMALSHVNVDCLCLACNALFGSDCVVLCVPADPMSSADQQQDPGSQVCTFLCMAPTEKLFQIWHALSSALLPKGHARTGGTEKPAKALALVLMHASTLRHQVNCSTMHNKM